MEENASIRAIGRKRAEKLEADAVKDDAPERRDALAKEAAELKAALPDERFPTQIFTGDATPEAAQDMLVQAGGKIAFLSDEGGLLQVMAGVYSGGDAVLDVFLQGYSGNDVRVNRRCRAAIIERPAITLGLSIQPVNYSTMANAVSLAMKLIDHARAVFGLVGSDKTTDDA